MPCGVSRFASGLKANLEHGTHPSREQGVTIAMTNQGAQSHESSATFGHVRAVISQVVFRHCSDFCASDAWAPAVNLYRLPGRVEICIDLAGVEPNSLAVCVEPGRLVIRGHRHSPEPSRVDGEAMHIIAMEIDHGPFSRVLSLPEESELSRLQTRYDQGLLWIRVPVREPG